MEVYSFFGTTTNVTRSTVSGNVALDVAGGMRTLGDVNVDNSTLSGNTSTAWHGGAMFITDGIANVTNSTVAGNSAPGGTTGGLFVGTFGPSSATLNIQNTIVADNGDFGCFLAPCVARREPGDRRGQHGRLPGDRSARLRPRRRL